MESAGPSFFDTEFGKMTALRLKYKCSLHTNTSYPVFASLPTFHTHHTFILLSIYMKNVTYAIAPRPFNYDNLPQVPPFCILYL